MKKLFASFIVCIALVGLKAQIAPNPFPFQFSTNTGLGAVWYIIQQDRNSSNGIRPWVPNGLDKAIGMRWSLPDPKLEDELFCFIGDNINGFNIYNKAYLAGKIVGGVTLTQDLKLQNLAVLISTKVPVGFTTGTPVTGNDLVDKFVIAEGNGLVHDKLARTGYFKICAPGAGTQLSWNLDNVSACILSKNDWGSTYNNTFLGPYTVPPTPTGLTASAQNSNVTLAWMPSTNVTGYNVYRGTTAGGESTTAIASNITTLSYSDNSVTNGIAYYYEVKAVNTIGTSGFSNEAALTTIITGAATTQAFTTTYGTVSAKQDFAVSGSNLTGDIIATAPMGFEVANDGINFGTTATLTQSTGSATGTISVRLKADALVGSYNNINIVLSSTGAIQFNITTPSSGNTITANLLTASNNNLSNLGYSDLQLANGNLTVLSGELALDDSKTINSITVNAGARLTLNVGQTITTNTLNLKSDDVNGTATFKDDGGTLIVKGTVNVEQYLGSTRNWYVSSPVSNAVAPSGYSYFKYDEAGNNPHTPITLPETSYWESVGIGTVFDKGKGYISLPGITPTTLTFSTSSNGTLNTGDIPVTLTRTTGKTKEGFNLVGNPYPSHITWTSAKAVSANVSNSIWYRTYNNSTSSYAFNTYLINEDGTHVEVPEGTTGIIPPMQAFWVRANTGGGTLTFTNDMRSHQLSNPLKAPASKATTTQSMLRIQVSNGINSDETVVYFNQNASNNLDAYDSPKMSNGSVVIPEIYSLVGTEQLVINGMNSIPYNSELLLGFTTGESNTFTIKASQIDNFDAGTQIILRDKVLNTEKDLAVCDYIFTSDAITNNATRFTLTFKAPSLTTELKQTNNGNVWITNANHQILINGTPNSETIVSVYNAVGQKLLSEKLTAKSKALNSQFATGVYMVTITNAVKSTTTKIIVN